MTNETETNGEKMEIVKRYEARANRFMNRVILPYGLLCLGSIFTGLVGMNQYGNRPKPESVIQYRVESRDLGRLERVRGDFEEMPELNDLCAYISEPLDKIISSKRNRFGELRDSREYGIYMDSSLFENSLMKLGVIGVVGGLGGVFSGVPIGFWQEKKKKKELSELNEEKIK